MKAVLALFGLVLLTGCVARSVPRTEISGFIGGKPFAVSAPKDVNLSSLSIMADTNGAVSITVKDLQTRMNPDVITTTGDAQVKMIKEIGAQVGNAAAAAAK